MGGSKVVRGLDLSVGAALMLGYELYYLDSQLSIKFIIRAYS
jgi:hypothetical protein